ncbi:hypothetical protein Tasa_029_040 [Tanticharoenia sakaeratensis NBRC 103193]|uniref:Uncharacterized protein n=1 Tax=Tanticharoenia sakaeratensis NBRC 103193 TaxID=1231623 RepID=A0A0D6MM80_9PROT|nr:hypothetical protein Tasa_029_040 [Tanticharoenia sakaeratensis NBRC 103193]GBQ23131.1 hypothetical protein AA103193_2304 [Tanticharoenia sakaeratensis NBRC 103193]
MENAVAERIHAETGYGVSSDDAAEHVMPLKDLMEENPIEEAAETYAENDARSLD